MDRCIRMLANVPKLVDKQRQDPTLNAVRTTLLGNGDEPDSAQVRSQYLVDDQELLWAIGQNKRHRLAIPRSLVTDLLALVHVQHGHPGVAATTELLRHRFHWPHLHRDAREYVLSCGCRHRKRTRSQQIAMLPARFLEPWEVLEIDIQNMRHASAGANKYLLLVVDKTSKCPFAYPIASKEAIKVARHLLELCLTFGTPVSIRSDAGGEFFADVVKHLCRWLKMEINSGPANHPRGQGALERPGSGMHDVLSEL